jgi:hypothetical protein
MKKEKHCKQTVYLLIKTKKEMIDRQSIVEILNDGDRYSEIAKEHFEH